MIELVALAPVFLAPIAEAPAGRDTDPCPLASFGWVLFADDSRRVPDFWWEDSLEVQEIEVCAHGISFVFLGKDAGTLYLATLMFEDPRGGSIPDRWLRQAGRSREDLEQRYGTLLSEVDRLSGGDLMRSRRLDLRRAGVREKAWILNPVSRLVLRWHNREVVLRGYLNVYLSRFV